MFLVRGNLFYDSIVQVIMKHVKIQGNIRGFIIAMGKDFFATIFCSDLFSFIVCLLFTVNENI